MDELEDYDYGACGGCTCCSEEECRTFAESPCESRALRVLGGLMDEQSPLEQAMADLLRVVAGLLVEVGALGGIAYFAWIIPAAAGWWAR